jgi:tRNase Z endonuclease
MPASSPLFRRHKRNIRTKLPESPSSSHELHSHFTRLQVVNTFSSETTSPSVMLHTQRHTYIFNCGEGTQRICQSRGRMPSNSDIFLTRVNWDVAGGLPGIPCENVT